MAIPPRILKVSIHHGFDHLHLASFRKLKDFNKTQVRTVLIYKNHWRRDTQVKASKLTKDITKICFTDFGDKSIPLHFCNLT